MSIIRHKLVIQLDKLDLDLEGRVLYPGGTYTSILAFVDGETAFPPSTPTGSESGGSRTGYETTCAYGSVTGYAACFSAALSGSKVDKVLRIMLVFEMSLVLEPKRLMLGQLLLDP